jgi:hypothetical protein
VQLVDARVSGRRQRRRPVALPAVGDQVRRVQPRKLRAGAVGGEGYRVGVRHLAHLKCEESGLVHVISADIRKAVFTAMPQGGYLGCGITTRVTRLLAASFLACYQLPCIADFHSCRPVVQEAQQQQCGAMNGRWGVVAE